MKFFNEYIKINNLNKINIYIGFFILLLINSPLIQYFKSFELYLIIFFIGYILLTNFENKNNFYLIIISSLVLFLFYLFTNSFSVFISIFCLIIIFYSHIKQTSNLIYFFLILSTISIWLTFLNNNLNLIEFNSLAVGSKYTRVYNYNIFGIFEEKFQPLFIFGEPSEFFFIYLISIIFLNINNYLNKFTLILFYLSSVLIGSAAIFIVPFVYFYLNKNNRSDIYVFILIILLFIISPSFDRFYYRFNFSSFEHSFSNTRYNALQGNIDNLISCVYSFKIFCLNNNFSVNNFTDTIVISPIIFIPFYLLLINLVFQKLNIVLVFLLISSLIKVGIFENVIFAVIMNKYYYENKY